MPHIEIMKSKSLVPTVNGIDEERTLKPRFEKYDKESGSLDSEGLWYGEGEVQDEEEEDSDQEEQEQLGLQQEDESETEVFSSSISLFRVLGGSDQ
jgi:hypothetical protein